MNPEESKQVKKHDWGMFVGGIAVILIGLIALFWPGVTLVTITVAAGVFLLFAGVAEIVGYFAYKNTKAVSGWQIAGGICNILLGAIFLLNPVVSAVLMPWIAGFAIIAYGIVSIAGGIGLKKTMPGSWGWFVANGVLAIICGILFFLFPESFIIFLSIFLIARGVTMMVYGATMPKDQAQEALYGYSDDDVASAMDALDEEEAEAEAQDDAEKQARDAGREEARAENKAEHEAEKEAAHAEREEEKAEKKEEHEAERDEREEEKQARKAEKELEHEIREAEK